MDAFQVSIVLPTLREAENLPPLVERIAAALTGFNYEIVVVDDDSRDGTVAVCAQLAERYPLRLIVRTEPIAGLSGAVLEGLSAARGRTLIVMDADLQHPPELLPQLIEPLRTGQADFVIGSRYMPGSSIAQRWGLLRRINSRVATLLASPFSGGVSDPMSGFFALRRDTFCSAQRLAPLGYKIALELMCKCRVQRVKEVPIHFEQRRAGQSKLSLSQQFRYLEHLSRLYDFTFPRAAPMLKFLIVVACGWSTAAVAYLLLRHALSPWIAVVIAYGSNLLITALFHLRYVRTQRQFLGTPRPWLDFAVISIAEWIMCGLVALWATLRFNASAAELFILSFGAATVLRYVLRKEFLLDVRGLRRELRKDELIP